MLENSFVPDTYCTLSATKDFAHSPQDSLIEQRLIILRHSRTVQTTGKWTKVLGNYLIDSRESRARQIWNSSLSCLSEEALQVIALQQIGTVEDSSGEVAEVYACEGVLEQISNVPDVAQWQQLTTPRVLPPNLT